jgi:hypothetical protein
MLIIANETVVFTTLDVTVILCMFSRAGFTA